jgi:hypothetical protein
MCGKPTECPRTARRLGEVLLGYLRVAGFGAAWPGGDGLTLEDLLDAYPEAVARGEVPDWQQLRRRHTELDTALQAWMAAKDRWQFAFRRDRLVQPRNTDPRDTEAQRDEGDL